MARESYSSSSTVVLTTHERSGYFSSVLGDDIDLRFDPWRDPSLDDLLNNIVLSGGRLVVIDEDYFPYVDDMISGLERFVDGNERSRYLEIIVVCSHRYVGDRLLAHLVTYCQLFNIIYGKHGPDISIALRSMLDQPNTRLQVAELAECLRWRSEKQENSSSERTAGANEYSNTALLTVSFGRHSECHELFAGSGESNEVNINIAFVAKRGL